MWVSKSQEKLADELVALGHDVSANTVGRLLVEDGSPVHISREREMKAGRERARAQERGSAGNERPTAGAPWQEHCRCVHAIPAIHRARCGRCGGHVAVYGRDKYLNLLACGGVALGSQ
jgi:hypothetical protein